MGNRNREPRNGAVSKAIVFSLMGLLIAILIPSNAGQTKEKNTKLTYEKVELQKQNILQHIDMVKKQFAINEKTLIEKYGEDSVINIQTGEVTKKEK